MTVISVSDGVNGSSLHRMSAQRVSLRLKAARISESTTKASCERESRAARRRLRDPDKSLLKWIVLTIFFSLFFQHWISKRCGQASKLTEHVEPLGQEPLQLVQSESKPWQILFKSTWAVITALIALSWLITLRLAWLMNDEDDNTPSPPAASVPPPLADSNQTK